MSIKNRSHFVILVNLLLIPFLTQAKDTEPTGDLKNEIKEYIFHHLEDTYDFSLFSYKNGRGEKVFIGIPLPVILWDDGLQIFSSSKHRGLNSTSH